MWVLRALFESLNSLERETGGDDVNVQIAVIENMHYIYSEMRARRLITLDSFVKLAKSNYDASLNIYCKAVIRKPFLKLQEFFEGVEQLLKTQNYDEVSYNHMFSKNTLKEVIKKHPLKEVSKGVEGLYKRVDKHFRGEEGDHGSGQLLQVVWRGIQEELVSSLRKYEDRKSHRVSLNFLVIEKCYGRDGLKLEFSVEEVLSMFSDLSLFYS
ncbi:MAG: hypothetical protein SGCHY_002214 [Lobulomycetales sp.]